MTTIIVTGYQSSKEEFFQTTAQGWKLLKKGTTQYIAAILACLDPTSLTRSDE